jgi:alpha-glucan,water dikinase
MDFGLLDFVLFYPDEGRWDNNHGRNYRIEMPGRKRPPTPPWGDEHEAMAAEIIEKETGRNSWTLMHRFDLCHDLLGRVEVDDLDGLALLFVWLRFSAIRQLDWQRNYNTQPRELGHSLDRLTLRLAGRYAGEPGSREMVRLMMGTLGRGSNAQRVRDEILNIMHRHHIKEVSGHFMEEWHQKLHNNATPDDIAICKAYIEFMRRDGDLGRFYERLREEGVSRERMEGYERPIRSSPDFHPHLKGALIRDFEQFLGVLKEVHSGTDLGIAIHNSRRLMDEDMHGLMDYIWARHADPGTPVAELAEKVTGARRRLRGRMEGPAEEVRDLLFLDIALEDFMRTAVERRLDSGLGGEELVGLVSLALENLCLTHEDDEFTNCFHHWRRLEGMVHFQRLWSLRAKSVLDRMTRALGAFIDHYHRLLGPRAGLLGGAFQADPWAVELFTAEVLRGRPAFLLSTLLRFLDPVLRKGAELGDWQVISRGEGTGEAVVVETLRSIQGKAFPRPAVILAGSLDGDEEIPGGVAAIITPYLVDVLSHLAIRARNAGVLFAVCHEPMIMDGLKALEGRTLKLVVEASGDLAFDESYEETAAPPPSAQPFRRALARPGFTAYALRVEDFTGGHVGYKSGNLGRLLGKLPSWIELPLSVALPFGVFERVLADEGNRETAGKCGELLQRIGDEEDPGEALIGLKKSVMALSAPAELASSLRMAMEESGLGPPSDWEAAWTSIKRVWGSKWNERAFLSRRANGIPHGDLDMSVLIQRVVEAEYSYVIHTVNPFTEAGDEIYAEVVLGLGETLTGSYPGRALGFTAGKTGEGPHILSFPGKSVGFFGGGLIFRSDSNGEDLAGYAGAGLYDSFILPPPRMASLDYTGDPLIWDDRFQEDFMRAVAGVGKAVEEAMGCAQDIEGAFSKGRHYVVQARPQVGVEDG